MMKSKSEINVRPLSPSRLVPPQTPALFRPLRAMHEIKRRIFKELLRRMDKEKPFAA